VAGCGFGEGNSGLEAVLWIFVLTGTFEFLFQFWLIVLFMVDFVLWVLNIDGLCVDRFGRWVVRVGKRD
jgi:hypothetical protein